MNFTLRGAGLVLLPLVCVLVGCGEKGKPVTLVEGRLLDNGTPIKATPPPNLPPGEKGFRMTFVALDSTGKTGEQLDAVVNEDGTFRVGGQNNKGIAAGKYRIALHKGAFGMPDQFANAFTVEKSPMTIDIPAAKSVKVDVDIGKKAATINQ